jgi:membrane protease YdiL (CAAX protease family)
MAGAFWLAKQITFIAGICVIAAVAAGAQYLGLTLMLYIWEFAVDLKVLFATALVFYLWRKSTSLQEIASIVGFKRWNLKRYAGWFFASLLIASIVVGIGFLLKQVKYAELENAATIALAIFFDIPAILFFSITTIFLEELVFRGFLLSELLKGKSLFASITISSLIWTIFKSSEIVDTETPGLLAIMSILLFSFSIGSVSAILFRSHQTLWSAYFFRVGASIFFPAILGNFAQDADNFFEAKSVLFLGDGIVISIFLFAVFAQLIYRSQKKTPVSS